MVNRNDRDWVTEDGELLRARVQQLNQSTNPLAVKSHLSA